MYQAQQDAELGEQSRQSPKISKKVHNNFLLGDIEVSALKTKGRVKQRTVLVFFVEN